MQLAKEDFKQNLLKTLFEKVEGLDVENSKFTIVPIEEQNVRYNSTDEYIKSVMFNRINIENRFFTLNELIDFLVYPNEKYPRLFPLWVKVRQIGSSPDFLFELRVSLRFRTCTQLKYIETGHPPFVIDSESL